MISIVIPTINSSKEEYLDEAIQSALLISNKIVDEIIIVDNSLSDDFYAKIERHHDQDSRLKIKRIEEKVLMAECWNSGLNEVKNDWHLYLHDDDVLLSESLNSINSLPDEKGFISFDFIELNTGRETFTKRSSGFTGIIENTPKFVSTIFSTSKLKEIGGWSSQAGYALDFLVFLTLEKKYGSTHINKVLGKYRIHQDNASSLEKRERGYGDSLPFVLSELFTIYKSTEERKKILHHLTSFIYPSNSLTSKAFRKLGHLFGKDIWSAN